MSSKSTAAQNSRKFQAAVQTTQLFDFRKDTLHIRVRSWDHVLCYKLAKSLCICCARLYG